MPKIIKTMLLFIALLAVSLVLGLLWMAKGLQSAHTFEAPAQELTGLETKTSTDTATLKVVVWNIAWAYGWGSEGSGGAKPKLHFEETLAKMGKVLKDANPDIVLMQEVDLGAHRSHDMNQAEMLAKASGLPWVAEAVSWEANYLPFPYWPPENHYGQVRSGGAIISRYPITKNTVELYNKPAENAFVYNLGYPFRYLQMAQIQVGDHKLAVFNAHLDAFSTANRQAHAKHIANTLTNKMQPAILFGADLNTVPPESTVRSDYPDEKESNHEEDTTLAYLRAVEGISDALTEDEFIKNQADYFTFPAHAANRKLDFIFAGSAYEVVSFRVMTEAGDLSDHLPVMAVLKRR